MENKGSPDRKISLIAKEVRSIYDDMYNYADSKGIKVAQYRQDYFPQMIKRSISEVINNDLQFHPNKLTLDLDPDNEFIWNENSINKINQKFNELIKERAGKNLDDYELRKIGSEIEGLIQSLLQNGQLSYNPECRVMNYSMGLPKTNEVL